MLQNILLNLPPQTVKSSTDLESLGIVCVEEWVAVGDGLVAGPALERVEGLLEVGLDLAVVAVAAESVLRLEYLPALCDGMAAEMWAVAVEHLLAGFHLPYK